MAARVSASGEYLRRTANLPSSENFTACGWARRASAQTGTYRYFFQLEDALTNAANYLGLGWNNSNQFSAQSSAGQSQFGSEPAVGDWFFWAMTGTTAGSGSLVGYWRGMAATTFVSTSVFGVSMTEALLSFGNDSYDEWFDGRIAGLKVWDAVLTSAELMAESFQLLPVRRTNLHGFWPMFRHTELDDLSGAGKTLTAGGTLSTEEGPPVPFKRARRRFFPVSAAAGGTVISVPVRSHTYTPQAPKLNAKVQPGAATHNYTAQTPKATAKVQPSAVAHTYTARAPQINVKVQPGVATHTYTGQVPTIGVSSGGTTVAAPAVAHTYTGQVPQLDAKVQPDPATHTHTGQVPNVRANVQPAAAAHTYAAAAPKLNVSVQPGAATHTYTARVPGVSTGGAQALGGRLYIDLATGHILWRLF